MPTQDRTVVKYKDFEVVCYPETLYKYRNNQLSFDKTCIISTIFKNATTGDIAYSAQLKKAFDTDNPQTCVELILKKGEYKL